MHVRAAQSPHRCCDHERALCAARVLGSRAPTAHIPMMNGTATPLLVTASQSSVHHLAQKPTAQQK